MRYPVDSNDVFDYGFDTEKLEITPELKEHLINIAVCDGVGNEPLLAGLVLLLLQRVEKEDDS